MYKFLGYMQSDRRLQHTSIKKFERMASEILEENPPQMDVDRYMITVGRYMYYGVSFKLHAYYYGDNFNKMRFILSNDGKKEIILYLKRED